MRKYRPPFLYVPDADCVPHLVEDDVLEQFLVLWGNEVGSIESHRPRRADRLLQLRYIAQKCFVSLQGRIRRNVRAAMYIAMRITAGFAFLE